MSETPCATSASCTSILCGTISTELNFIRPEARATPEVFYSGASEPQSYSDAYAFMPQEIEDGRPDVSSFTIHKEGFQIATAPTANDNFHDDQAIVDRTYGEVAAIVRKATGARDVFVFDHTVRFGRTTSLRKPAHHVHNDYTEETGLSRAREALGEEAFAKMQGRRMIQINVWRPLQDVVLRSPLAFCDASSINPQDFVRTRIHFPDTNYIGEIYALRQAQGQRWVYFSEMTRNEVVLIKGYDTLHEGVARFTPHTAFEYPDQDPNTGPRHSIETRTFAFY